MGTKSSENSGFVPFTNTVRPTHTKRCGFCGSINVGNNLTCSDCGTTNPGTRFKLRGKKKETKKNDNGRFS